MKDMIKCSELDLSLLEEQTVLEPLRCFSSPSCVFSNRVGIKSEIKTERGQFGKFFLKKAEVKQSAPVLPVQQIRDQRGN